MPGNLTFASDHAEIRGDFFDVLNSVVLVLNEYDKTLIEITGHTDNTGSDAHNQQLSEERARSVAAYFKSREVVPERLVTEGFGEKFPVASNDTPQGRQENRRVELRLVPLTKG
jgi:outer membrane protein OmpA-like peptidoglycan-associated protein